MKIYTYYMHIYIYRQIRIRRPGAAAQHQIKRVSLQTYKTTISDLPERFTLSLSPPPPFSLSLSPSVGPSRFHLPYPFLR